MREHENGSNEGSKGRDMNPSECREEIEMKRGREERREGTESRVGNREETVKNRDGKRK